MHEHGQCSRCWGVFRSAEETGKALGPGPMAALLAKTDGAAQGLGCPACGGQCREVAFNGWFLDVCSACHGVFVDWGESLVRARWAKDRRSLWTRLREALRRAPPVPGAAAPPFVDYRLLETLSVPNTSPAKVATRTSTVKGAPYLLEASGEVSNWSGRLRGVDALYCYAVWRVGKEPQKWAQLRVDDRSLEELGGGAPLPYDPRHVYRVPFPGTGAPLGLHLSDARDSWVDNRGALTVRLYAKG